MTERTWDHISWSQLNMYLRCGVQYERRYIKDEIIPPSAAQVRGRCGHKALEKNFKQKIETKIDLPVEEVLDEFSDKWEQEKYTIAFTKEELEGRSPSAVAGEFKDSGIILVRAYHQEQSPLADPVTVEERCEIEFEGDYPKLVAVMDRVDAGDVVCESKFLKRTPSKDDELKDMQLTAYDYVFRTTRGRKPSRLIKQAAIALKTPKTVCLVAPPRPDDQINVFLNRLLKAIEGIKGGYFAPAAHGVFWCGSKWCGYWHTCPYRQ